jgi:outer membrane lipoprotein-sorting protein
VVIGAWGLLFSGAGQAYVLPGPHLLELMTQKLGSFNTLLVQQQVTIYRDDTQQQALVLTEKLRYQAPDRYRCETISDYSQRILVSNKNQQIVIIDHEIDPDGETRFDIYRDLLFLRDRQTLEAQLARRGIDVFFTSYGRFQDRIGFVIGAQYPDESVSQVWLDNITMKPFRWIFVEAAGRIENQFFEIIYSDWRQSGRIWYPFKIEFYQEGVLVRQTNVLDVRAGVTFEPALFDISALRRQYARDRSDKPSQEVNTLDEITEAIDDFRKLYE